jgi:hypothetical protein
MSIQAIRRNNPGSVTALAVAMGLLAGAAGAAPRIDGPPSRECRDTLSAADTAFYSKAFRLSDAIALPPGAPVRIVVQRAAGDISGGDAVVADRGVFKTLSQADHDDVRKIYWQVSPQAGIRWVVTDRPAGWRGDIYDLYALDPSDVEAGFVVAEGADPHKILGERWLPALMLRGARTGAIWAVDTSGFDIPDIWSIYTAGKDGVKSRCQIVFGPKVKTVFNLLPARVHTLAVDLDGTLGTGRDEGTLQPTSRIRDEVDQAWADIALRPWAVSVKPYHSRRNADAGLRHWSQGAPSFRALYLRIQADYPAAVDALADLYVQRFAKTPQAAHALAEHNLDIVYRMHFVFPQSYIHPAPPAKRAT